MTPQRFVWLVFGGLLALLPVLLSAGPWDPNRPRPAGFQRTLGYLADDLVNHPDSQLQSIRSKMLGDDLLTGVIAALKNSGIPPANWEAEGQKAYDAYRTQYEQVKTLIRQTMTNPEGIIQAVEGNQQLGADLAGHPNIRALIAVKWQMLNVAEQTYQALLHAGLKPSGGTGGPHGSVPNITPRTPAKSKARIDWERMRETRRKALERRRALEARWAEEARRRWEEINEIIRYLRGLGAQSANKFQATRPGAGGSMPAPAMPELTPMPPEPAGEPVPTTEEIEQIDEQMDELVEKMEEPEREEARKEVKKVKVYRGTLILRRPEGLSDNMWQQLKAGLLPNLSQIPGLSDMTDKGDEVTWRHKGLAPLPASDPLEYVSDGEPTEEGMDGEPAPKEEEEKPKFEGNGDASPTDGTVVPGTEEKPVAEKPQAPTAKPPAGPVAAKPVPKPAPPKAKPIPGYWFDPTDNDADDTDPTIYVRIDGVATRMTLNEAKDPRIGVPVNATVATMTWYNERLGKITKNANLGTHRGKP